MDLGAGPGVVVREFTLDTGEADYVLFVDREACGVIEAKPDGTTLSGVADQTSRYQSGVPDVLPTHEHGMCFAYESTGVEMFFRDEDALADIRLKLGCYDIGIGDEFLM
jgi:type I restriction enzyme, R subunit